MSGKDVSVLLDKEKENVIEKNRKRLVPIIQTIEFCGRNNLPLRGHREKGSMKDETTQKNALMGTQGIFRSLLVFRMESGDTILTQHFQSTTGQNSTMVSGKIQNDLIYAMGEQVRSSILLRIKKARYFSILCDETTDLAKMEQLTLCIRYVDVETSFIREDFIGFVEMKSTTGLEIKKTIVTELTKIGLSLTHLRGQGYDGGSNMAGHYKGVHALILNEQPLAFYTHCFSHSLNLAISKCCEVSAIKNVMGIVNSISSFLSASAKRVNLLKDIIIEENISEMKKKKIENTLCHAMGGKTRYHFDISRTISNDYNSA
ncbi:hypothetical protein NQ314_010749 [Rhamnusium bicolor]|uniref:DUF4371 domain-containing protein n=1 Tax=Rhamnusium bicolor TaxID=1586634 RepID=A0AAV8XNI3_9CUCU|nr:hypothetical protein NQ314_010749 [Rhamnusium bicolor]